MVLEREDSHGYRCRRLVVGFGHMDRREVGRVFVRRQSVGVGERRRGRESVLGMGRVLRKVVGDFEGGRGFERSLVREDSRCCLECRRAVGDMAEEHRMAVGVDRNLGSRHRRSLGWTFYLGLVCFFAFIVCFVSFVS